MNKDEWFKPLLSLSRPLPWPCLPCGTASHDEDGEGEDEGERGKEDVGEVGDGEDGGCADVEGVDDAGPGHEDGDEGEAGVEDEEGGQGVRG